MLKSHIADHNVNRMGHEGDFANERKIYLSATNKNLELIPRHRF